MGTEDPNSGSRTASPSSAADDLVSWGTPGPRNLFLTSEGARSGPLSAPGGVRAARPVDAVVAWASWGWELGGSGHVRAVRTRSLPSAAAVTWLPRHGFLRSRAPFLLSRQHTLPECGSEGAGIPGTHWSCPPESKLAGEVGDHTLFRMGRVENGFDNTQANDRHTPQPHGNFLPTGLLVFILASLSFLYTGTPIN